MINRAEVIKELGRPISYYPSVAKVIGVNECIFLMQLIYWTTDGRGHDGWIYKSSEEWEAELGLTYKQQMKIRENLKKLQIIDEHNDRLHHKMHFKVNYERFNHVLEDAAKSGDFPKRPKVISGDDQRSVGGPPKGQSDIHRVQQRVQTEKEESPTLAKARESAPSIFPGKESMEGLGAGSPTEIPEDSSGAPVGQTEGTVASLPVRAAAAAHGNPEERPKGALPDPHDPDFPKEGRRPDYCAAIDRYDGEHARLMNTLWHADLFSDERLARKYYRARRYGTLTDLHIQMMSRFWAEAPLYGDERPSTLWDALDTGNLARLLAACRKGVQDAIGLIRDDGEMHMLQCLAAARGRVRKDTDMVQLLNTYPTLHPLLQPTEPPVIVAVPLAAQPPARHKGSTGRMTHAVEQYAHTVRVCPLVSSAACKSRPGPRA